MEGDLETERPGSIEAPPVLPTLAHFWSHLSFRRIVTSTRFIPEVDGFRFVAILIVVLSHIFGQCGPVPGQGRFMDLFRLGFSSSDSGHRGVYLFFVISGFILAMPFARHQLAGGNAVKLGHYFRRRVTRLEPPYVLAMLLRFPMVFLVKRTGFAALSLHLLASLFYMHNLAFAQPSTINPPAWSLEVEIQFYILAPLLATVFFLRQKHLRRLLLALATLAGGWLSWRLGDQGRLPLTLAAYSQYFFAGFLLCDLYVTEDAWRLPRWVWDILGIASLLWMLYTSLAWYPIVFPFAALLLYLAGFYGSVVRAVFAFRPISIVGGMCYSLYLTHTTVLTVMGHLSDRIYHSSLPIALQVAIVFSSALAAILVVGMIFFQLIERPCMDPQWPHKLALWFRRDTPARTLAGQ